MRGRDGAFDQAGAGEGAGGVVDEHDVGRARQERFKSRAHGRLPRRPAEYRDEDVEFAGQRAHEFGVLGTYDGLYEADVWGF